MRFWKEHRQNPAGVAVGVGDAPLQLQLDGSDEEISEIIFRKLELRTTTEPHDHAKSHKVCRLNIS